MLHARGLEPSVCGVVLMQVQSLRTALIARVGVDACCHCLCVSPLVKSFLGERLAHRDAADCDRDRCRVRHVQTLRVQRMTWCLLAAETSFGAWLW